MKGSPIRKRYILIRCETDPQVLEMIRRDVFRIFQAKEKFREPPYLIVLGNQNNKGQIIEYVNSSYPAETLLSSGTIRKLKRFIEERRSQLSLPENGELLLRQGKS